LSYFAQAWQDNVDDKTVVDMITNEVQLEWTEVPLTRHAIWMNKEQAL
jgi:hypothetical protein